MSARRSTRKRPGSLTSTLGDQKKRNTVPEISITDEEEMSETLILLQMTKKDKQSMFSYYQQLKQQAEKCGIQCCQDRVIRDRLIQAITEEAVLAEIGKMHSPTSKQVFATYTEIVQEQKVFPAVLPYLSMADISVLTRTTLRLEKIVRSYVKQGGNLTINDHVLREFPVIKNRNFYLKFNDALSVTLTEIAESVLSPIMSCFKQIQRFTMINMVILEDIKEFPRSLSELTLIKVQIEDPLFHELILNSKDTLKTLHLDKILTNWSNTSEGLYDFNDLCPNLNSLVVKVPSSNMCLDGHLNVKTKVFPKLIKKLPLKLESLYYDGFYHLNIENLNNLKHITLMNFPEGGFASTTVSLKMLGSYDYEDKSYFDDLNIKLLEIVYYNEPVTDLPSPNLILKKLNDDCLLKVSGYLFLYDRLSFAKSHPRIQQLVTRHGISALEVDSRNLTVVTENRKLWEVAASSLNKLKVYDLANDDLLWILTYCIGLKGLTLFDMACTMDFKMELANQLIRNTNQLKSLTELSIDTKLDLDCVLNILHRNKDSLEDFSFHVESAEHWAQFQGIWKVVAEMKHIREVFVEKCYQDTSDIALHRTHLERILSLVGMKLKRFGMSGMDDCVDSMKFNQLPEMTGLKLHINNSMSEKKWLTISSFKKLEKLNLYTIEGKLSYSEILSLIKSLPMLMALTINGFTYNLSLRFGVELKKYLLQENRFLRIIFQGVDDE